MNHQKLSRTSSLFLSQLFNFHQSIPSGLSVNFEYFQNYTDIFEWTTSEENSQVQ
jgi:hypothetical protein